MTFLIYVNEIKMTIMEWREYILAIEWASKTKAKYMIKSFHLMFQIFSSTNITLSI